MSYQRIDQYDEVKTKKLQSLVEKIIKEIDPNPKREGLEKTPKRYAKALQFINQGYGISPEDVLRSALFESNTKDMVIVKDIELYSLCEHHLLPFFGKAHVAYIPNGKIVGLSKIARVVDIFSRRLQVQERLTNQILNTLNASLKPLGVAIVIEAKHLCMMMRGIEKQNSVTTTSAFTGEFEHFATRNEFMNMVVNSLI